MGRVERPGSFGAEAMGDWEDWVLEHGVPQDVPETLAVDEIVPVACWRDETWAAVLHLMYREAEADPEQPAFDWEAGIDDETQTFRRAGDRREAAGGSGGGSWFDGLRLRAPGIGDDEAIVLGRGAHGEAGWLCGTARGVAGRSARTVEVEQAGRVVARPIDSPVGAWVTAFDGTQPAVVRVRNAEGVLVEQAIEPVRFRRFAPEVHGPVAPTHGAIEAWSWPPRRP
jgi:hypothetical protein